MANNPFDQEILNLMERPLSSDNNTAWSRIYQTEREFWQRFFSQRAAIYSPIAGTPLGGFVADGFLCKPPGSPAMTVTLNAGMGLQYNAGDVPSTIGGVVGLDDLQPYKPLSIIADQLINVPAAPGSNARIDLIEAKYNRVETDTDSRLILNPVTGIFTPNVVPKTLAWNLSGLVSLNGSSPINYKTGTPSGSPVAPSLDSGYIPVAYLYVPTGLTSIGAANIIDARTLLFPGNVAHLAFDIAQVTTGGGPNIPVISNAIIPPGLTVVAVGDSTGIGEAQMWIYIIGGNPQAAVLTATSGDFTSGSGHLEIPQVGYGLASGAAAVGLATSADNTRLTDASAASSVAFPVVSHGSSQGQAQQIAAFRFRMDPASGSLPGTANIHFSGFVAF